MENSELFDLLAWFPVGLMIICLITGGLKYPALGRIQRLIVIVVTFGLIAEALAYWLWSRSMNNFFVFHVYAVIEYSLFALIYARAVSSKKLSRVIRWSIPALIGIGIINALFGQSINEPNTNITTLISSVLILVSVYLFFRMLSEMRYPKIERSSLFWINIGVLIYYSSSLVLFTFGDWLEGQSLDYTLNVWVIHLFFNFIHYLAFTISLWMKPE